MSEPNKVLSVGAVQLYMVNFTDGTGRQQGTIVADCGDDQRGMPYLVFALSPSEFKEAMGKPVHKDIVKAVHAMKRRSAAESPEDFAPGEADEAIGGLS